MCKMGEWQRASPYLSIGIFDAEFSLHQTFEDALQAHELAVVWIGVVVAGPLQFQGDGYRETG